MYLGDHSSHSLHFVKKAAYSVTFSLPVMPNTFRHSYN